MDDSIDAFHPVMHAIDILTEAHQLLEETSIYPRSVDTAWELARTCIETGHTDLALQIVHALGEEVLQASDLSAYTLVYAAESILHLLQRLERYKEALTFLEQASERYERLFVFPEPLPVDPHLLLDICLHAEAHASFAWLNKLEAHARTLYPISLRVEWLYQLADAYCRLGAEAEAHRLRWRALLAAWRSGEPDVQGASLYRHALSHPSPTEALSMLSRLTDPYERAHRMLAYIRSLSGDNLPATYIAQALETTREAVLSIPEAEKRAEMLYKLIAYYLEQHAPSQVHALLHLFRRTLRQLSDPYEILLGLTRAFWTAHRLKLPEALDFLEEALALLPSVADSTYFEAYAEPYHAQVLARLHVAHALYACHRVEEARTLLMEALDIALSLKLSEEGSEDLLQVVAHLLKDALETDTLEAWIALIAERYPPHERDEIFYEIIDYLTGQNVELNAQAPLARLKTALALALRIQQSEYRALQLASIASAYLNLGAIAQAQTILPILESTSPLEAVRLRIFLHIEQGAFEEAWSLLMQLSEDEREHMAWPLTQKLLDKERFAEAIQITTCIQDTSKRIQLLIRIAKALHTASHKAPDELETS